MKKRFSKSYTVKFISLIFIFFIFTTITKTKEVIAFQTADGFSYSITNGKAWITKYTGSMRNVVVPAVLYNSDIPIEVEKISPNSFVQNENIESVTISEGIKSIEYNAFLYCTNLISVNLPMTLVSMNGTSFRNCLNLTEYNLHPNNPFLEQVDGIIYTQDMSTIISSPPLNEIKSIIIPESVNIISSGAMMNNVNLEKIVFHEKYIDVQDMAFNYCSSLNEVTLNMNTKISSYSFYGCSAIKSFNVHQDNPYFESISGVLFSQDLSLLIQFPAANNIEFFSLPIQTTNVRSNAFKDTVYLKIVILPEVMVSVPDGIFYDSKSINEVILSSKTENIGSNAFYNCTSLSMINLPETIKLISSGAFDNCDSITRIEIPQNVQRIGAMAFRGCDNLIEINLPDSITSMGEGAFENCVRLDTATIGSNLSEIPKRAFSGSISLKTIKIPSNIKLIGDSAFYNSSLVDLEISYGVESIGAWAFSYNKSLREIILPESVSYLGEGVFSDNSTLEVVTLSSKLTEIPKTAFYNCISLNKIDLHEGLLSIGNQAFSSTHALKIMLIPSTVNYIGSNCFNSAGITKIYFYGDAPFFESRPFNFSALESVYYKSGANNWDYISIFENVTLEPFYVIEYNSDFKLEDIPKDLKQYKSEDSTILQRFPIEANEINCNFIGWQIKNNDQNIVFPGNTKQTFSSNHIVLDALWTNEAVYTLSFENHLEDIVPDQYLRLDDIPIEPQLTSRDGYQFDGWYIDDGYFEKFDFGQKLVESTKLYAKWNVNSYLVEFDYNDGSEVKTNFIEHGSLLTKPENPVREGYTFGFWSWESDFIKPWYFDNDVVIQNLNLKAVWSINEYSVTFDSNGGNIITTESIPYGNPVVSPGIPHKDGFTFSGWYLDQQFEKEWNMDKNIVQDNMILYAKWIQNPIIGEATLNYRTHVQNIGWQDYVEAGTMSGTENRALRLEGIEILATGNPDLGVRYTTHVQNIGWQDYVSDGVMSGTENCALRLEAIKIELTGNDSSLYDIYYRVHAQNFGWMGWAKNGNAAGTAGYGYRLEAIEIILVQKGVIQNLSTANSYLSTIGMSDVRYRTHVQNLGWQDYVNEAEISGTEGRALRLEGINIELGDNLPSGSIEYSTHVQNLGWLNPVRDGAMSGTENIGMRLEAITIRLTGELSKEFDVYYRVHAQNVGWMGWAKNGEKAGTAGYGYRLEGIEIVMVPKGTLVPGSIEGQYLSSY